MNIQPYEHDPSLNIKKQADFSSPTHQKENKLRTRGYTLYCRVIHWWAVIQDSVV